jgi:putative endonuclease
VVTEQIANLSACKRRQGSNPCLSAFFSGCSVARSSRLVWDQEVAGSNPATPTTRSFLFQKGFFCLYRNLNILFMYFVYILYSPSKSRYYVGQTNTLEGRLQRHNSGQSLSTKHGLPWEMICSFPLQTRSEAMTLESKIKKRGIKRYLDEIGFQHDIR